MSYFFEIKGTPKVAVNLSEIAHMVLDEQKNTLRISLKNGDTLNDTSTGATTYAQVMAKLKNLNNGKS